MGGEAEEIKAEYARRARTVGDLYAFTSPGQLFMVQEAERLAVAALVAAGRVPVSEQRVLDVGCGGGDWLARFEIWGARRDRLAGIELVPERAAMAAARLPGTDVREGDATHLPWADGSFDVVFQSMMFSSIVSAEMRSAAAVEVARVLAPGGVVLWYDFFVTGRNRARTVAMGRAEIGRLFPGFDARLRRTTLAPPLVRRLAPRARPVATALAALRVLDTHLIGTLSRDA